MGEKFEQLELDGVLSKNDAPKEIAEKNQTEKPGLENTKPRQRKAWPGSGLVKSLEKDLSDPKKQSELHKRFKIQQEQRGDLYK